MFPFPDQNIIPEEELLPNPGLNIFPEEGMVPHLAGGDGNDQEQEEPHGLVNEPYFSEAYKKLKEKLCGALHVIIPNQPKISCSEFLLNALTLVTHFKMNFAQFEGLMKLVNTLFQDKVVPETRHLLDKLFMSMSGIHYHFVCSYCKDYIGEFDHTVVTEVFCENCERVTSIGNLNDCIFFVMFDLPIQTEVLFSDDEIFQSLKNPFDLINSQEPFVMSDVHDGSVYQNFIKFLGPRTNVRHISACFGVDGASPYTSSNMQLWPIFVNILELAPEVRAHNLLLGGLWFGKGHPQMDVFLIPFVEHCKKLSKDGFKIIRKGEEIFMKLHLLGCCADAPARADVQCIHVHGGSFSCHWCLHPSEHRRYDLLNYEPECRTRQEMIDDGAVAVALEDPTMFVNGVKGLSPLLTVPTMHIVDGMVLEYFHAAAHGIAKTFLGAWLGDDGCEDVPYYIGSPANLDKLNKLVKCIHLPVEARRAARDFEDWADWKGKELDNFISFHSVPLIEKLLPLPYVKHWVMFVQAMHFLLQEQVTLNNLEQAHVLLREFGRKVPELYPERHMTYNLHIISRHLAENSRRWGPLWSMNGYCFEDGNRILMSKIHANKGIASQVCRALSHIKCLEILRSHVSTPFTKKFQSDIEKKTVNSCMYVLNDKYFGPQKSFNPTNEEIFICNQKGIQLESFVQVQKLIHQHCVFTASKTRASQTDNSVALLKNGDIILTEKIIVSEQLSEGYLIGRKVRTAPHLKAPDVNHRDAFLKIVSSIDRESVFILPSELRIVCARMTFPHGDYIVKVPNIYNTS